MDNGLIYDIGFHRWEDTKYYLSQWYRVLAVDANPVLILNWQKMFPREINTGQLILINVWVGEENSESLKFYINHSKTEWSSFKVEAGTRWKKFHCVEVSVTTISSLFQSFWVPYYLKADIEWNDVYCARWLSSYNLPKYVSFEFSDISLLETLYQKWYNKFKLINQRNLWKPLNILTERSFFFQLVHILLFRWRAHYYKMFPSGSSGPFGEFTEGPWLDYRDVKNIIIQYKNLPKFKFLTHSWIDLHATRG